MSYSLPPDPNVVLTNFGYMATVLGDFGIVAGLVLTVIAFNQFKKHGESRSHGGGGGGGIAQPVATLIAGVMLLFLPVMMTSIVNIFFPGSSSDLAYDGGDTGVFAWCEVVIVFVRLIGVGAMMKGIIQLSRIGGQSQQPGSASKALIHLFGGALCLHIMGTIDFIEQFLGFAN